MKLRNWTSSAGRRYQAHITLRESEPYWHGVDADGRGGELVTETEVHEAATYPPIADCDAQEFESFCEDVRCGG